MYVIGKHFSSVRIKRSKSHGPRYLQLGGKDYNGNFDVLLKSIQQQTGSTFLPIISGP